MLLMNSILMSSCGALCKLVTTHQINLKNIYLWNLAPPSPLQQVQRTIQCKDEQQKHEKTVQGFVQILICPSYYSYLSNLSALDANVIDQDVQNVQPNSTLEEDVCLNVGMIEGRWRESEIEWGNQMLRVDVNWHQDMLA